MSTPHDGPASRTYDLAHDRIVFRKIRWSRLRDLLEVLRQRSQIVLWCGVLDVAGL